MVSDVALHQATRPKAWLLYAFATMILWGVWGAFTGHLARSAAFPRRWSIASGR